MGRDARDEEITIVHAVPAHGALVTRTRLELNAVGPAGKAVYMPLSCGMEVVIGRASTSHMRLDDLSVSRHHAKISFTAAGVIIIDLGSRNGTRVQGQLIECPHAIHVGDVVQIGAFLLTLGFASSGVRPRVSEPHLDDVADRLARAPVHFLLPPSVDKLSTELVRTNFTKRFSGYTQLADEALELRTNDPVAIVFGRRIPLTVLEERMLRALYRRRGMIVTRKRLIYEMWGSEPPSAPDRSLDDYIRRLRVKLGGCAHQQPVNLVETVRGRGFRLRFR